MNGNNLIGFLESSQGTSSFQTINPSSLKSLPTRFTCATFAEADKAVQLAHTAWDAYLQKTIDQRITFLSAIHYQILNLGGDLMDVFQEESGLSFQRAIAERTRTLSQIQLFIRLLKKGEWVNATIEQAIPERKPHPKPDIRKQLAPIGPVLVFGASNFPLAYSTAGGDTISALAAGCPVIVKSHPMHAGTSELVARAIIIAAKETHMPEGVFSHLNSSTFELGTYLVKHPQIKAVGFTGSIGGGTALMKMANERPEPIPVYAEMGSVNPILILPNYLRDKIEATALKIAHSIRTDAGQFCTSPGLIFMVSNPITDTFVNELAKQLNTTPPQAMVHPHIWRAFQTNKAKNLSHPMIQMVTASPDLEPNFITPVLTTTSAAQFLMNPNFSEEVFGAYTLIVYCLDIAELNACVRHLAGQLTGSFFATTQELKDNTELIRNLKSKVGRLIFNGVPTGVEVCQSMHHGGPFPATSHSHFSAVGEDAIKRWTRPISYQNWPNELLPKPLQNENTLDIMRTIDGEWTSKKLP